jgi:peptidoglycan/LPS O-acetylase OafA/YrhL
MSPSLEDPLGYRPALDGVRALSIIAVMAFHSGLISGGWLGVDVFFTLSGFLITTLLLDERNRTGDVDLHAFYWRRFLRLVPALAVVAIICTARTVAIIPEGHRASVVLSLVAIMFYVGNWAAIAGAPQALLGHTWSLSIEEQFYLLWPPAIRLLLRRVSARGVLVGLLAAATASAAYRCIAAQRGPDSDLGRYLYLGTLTHADGILIGCALACWVRMPSTSFNAVMVQIGGVCGLLFMAVALIIVPFHYYFSWWTPTTAIALATCLVISGTLRSGSWIGRLLGLPPCVWLGKRSYGIYLWHVPVFVALSALSERGLRYNSGRVVLAWIATFGIAALSYRYIEAPLLRFKQPRVGDRESRLSAVVVP